jgi:predicted nucleotidyltransferase
MARAVGGLEKPVVFPLETVERGVLRAQLRRAIARTMKRYPRLKGVFFYGSFGGKGPFNDIDVLPVFDRYTPTWEDFNYTYEAEEYLRGHFPLLP